MVRRDACGVGGRRGEGGEEGGGGRGEEGRGAPTATASCYIGDLLVDQ